MKEPTIQNLFPTPIYMTNMDRPFTKQELQFVEKQKNIILILVLELMYYFHQHLIIMLPKIYLQKKE